MPPVEPLLVSLLRETGDPALLPPVSDSASWERLVQDTADHRVLPHLWRWLRDAGLDRALPASLVENVQARLAGLAARNLLMAQEFSALLQGFAQHHVECIPLRGLALADYLHEDPLQRPMGDIDLLVRKHDYPKVGAILTGLGFQEVDRRRGFALAYSYTQKFIKDRHGWVIVEPHWSIAYPPFVDRIDMEQVWNRRIRTNVLGVDSWRLDPSDLLLHLCLHLVHRMDSAPLLWLFEMDRLLRKVEDAIDWNQLLSEARNSGQAVLVSCALQEVVCRFNSPVPGWILTGLTTHPTTDSIKEAPVSHGREMEQRAVRLLVGKTRIDGGESLALFLMLRGVKAKLSYMRALLFPSSGFMVQQYGLAGRWGIRLGYLSRFALFFREGLKGLIGLMRAQEKRRAG